MKKNGWPADGVPCPSGRKPDLFRHSRGLQGWRDWRLGRGELAFSDPGNNNYLSISATAHTSQDREKLKELWSMFTEAWLPQGPEAEDVALITVEPEEAKLWDSTSSTVVYAGKVLKAVVTQQPPSGGRVEEVSMGGDTSSSDGAVPDSRTMEAYDEVMKDAAGTVSGSSAAGPSI